MGQHEGLTLHQVAVLELIRFKARGKGFCWGKQTEMAAALWMTRKVFNLTLKSLLEKGLLAAVERRQYDTVFRLSVDPIGTSQLIPSAHPDVPIGTSVDPIGTSVMNSKETKRELVSSLSSNLQSKALLDEWNQKFPETIPGANQLLDQNALLQLLETHQRTPQQIVELMEYIEHTQVIGFYSRPLNLIRRSAQGNGTFAFIQLTLKMQAKKNGGRESTDDKIARLDAERQERKRQRATAE